MDGILRIERVAALMDVWVSADLFPFPKMKVKVIERSPLDFLAVANVSRRNGESGDPEYCSGLGGSIEEALNDLLLRFVEDVQKHSEGVELTLDDFEWSAPEDF